MGPSETAITIPGALEKLTFFTGTGRHRAQIAHFFRGQIGSWRPLGVGLVVGSRLYRIRHRCSRLVVSESTRPLHRWRMRCRRLPPTRPTSRDLQEPIYPRKKCAIWTRWHPVPVKNANYPRAPSSRRSGLVGPHTTPPIVNYKYMTSTL